MINWIKSCLEGGNSFSVSPNPCQSSVAFHIDTSHLIYTAKQMTGFCMKGNSVLEWVNAFTINKILSIESVINILVKWSLFLIGDQPMNDQFFHFTKTSQGIYIINQLTSFYMRGTWVINRLKEVSIWVWYVETFWNLFMMPHKFDVFNNPFVNGWKWHF